MVVSKKIIRISIFMIIVMVWAWFFFEIFDKTNGLLLPLKHSNFILYFIVKLFYIGIGALLGLYEIKNINRPRI